MCPHTITKILNVVIIVAGVLSAIFWTIAATIVVRSDRPDNQYRDNVTVSNGADFFATVQVQTRWNRRAAIAAAVVAIAQVGITVLK